ncbi:VOC family protein [Paracoccus sp. (in: a-proteobacteria)]|uniref:VOC family protein n=1 Tax=Paracoccus sp. TaxID=267 RepID=UPI003A850B70
MTAAAPPILGTLETALYADDLEAATRFWVDVIGLSVIAALPGRHVFFRVTGDPRPQVLLVFNPEATGKAPPEGTPNAAPAHGARGPGHFCLAVATRRLDDWRAHLIAHGVGIEADFRWPGGARSIYFRDPAGNSIEIAEPALWA